MKKLIICLVLTACAPSPPVFKPVPIEIPIAQNCVAPLVTKPDFALAHIAASDDLFTKAKAALVELDQRKAYEAELEARVGDICP